MDQIYGKNGPGTSSWRGHDEAITNICRCGTYQRVRSAIKRAGGVKT